MALIFIIKEDQRPKNKYKYRSYEQYDFRLLSWADIAGTPKDC